MAHRKKGSEDPVSEAFIQEICALYGDCYDDRLEDSRPPAARRKKGIEGEYLEPDMLAGHKSLATFQKELAEKNNIRLSTSKIRKILISGGCWSTERSREVQALYDDLTHSQVDIDPETIISLISQKLAISKVAVNVNMPYIIGVYRLEERSKNAQRCARYRAKKKDALHALKVIIPPNNELRQFEERVTTIDTTNQGMRKRKQGIISTSRVSPADADEWASEGGITGR